MCEILPFPLSRRIGKIRDVAAKLAAKTTDRHADFYVTQVTEGLHAHFERVGVLKENRDEQISAFWSKVDQEVARLSYRGTGSNDPRGAA